MSVTDFRSLFEKIASHSLPNNAPNDPPVCESAQAKAEGERSGNRGAPANRFVSMSEQGGKESEGSAATVARDTIHNDQEERAPTQEQPIIRHGMSG